MSIDLKTCRVGAVAAVRDLASARTFYEGPLGLEPGHEEGGAAVSYPCGRDTELLVYASEHAGGYDATVAAFEVPDVVAAVQDLTARGVAFEHYDDQPGIETDALGVVDAGRFKTAWFRDPDGNTFMVIGS